MKILTFAITSIAAVCLATAQTVTETTTTVAPAQAVGTVTTFSPSESIIIRGADSAPVTYGYSKSTVIVDELGNPVGVDVVRSGVPVTVYYTENGGQRVASRVVVQKAPTSVIEERTTTTTTTTKDDDDDDEDDD